VVILIEKVGIYCYKVKKGREFNAAEIVANRADLSKLDIRTILVTEIQGYLFSPPLKSEDFVSFLRADSTKLRAIS